MKLISGAIAGLALLAGAASAEEKRVDLPTELADIFAGSGAPGAAVAVIENGKVSFVKGYGLADVETKVSVTPQTVFRTGSVAKSIVGVVVMMLVEEGRLSLDDKLADMAPEIPFDNPFESEEPLLLKHLLEHTTGWADLSPKEFALDDSQMSLLDGILVGGARKSRYLPGLYHAYTSAGYGVAGYIVEKIEGKPFRDIARERVFVPLGMTSASYDETPGMAKSYMPDGTATPYQQYPLYPAGGLNLSAEDFAKFVQFMIDEGKVGGRTLLSPASVARIERSETTLAALAGLADGYGLGNAAYVGEKAVLRGHGGVIDSFNAEYRYLRACRCGFVVMANADPVPRAAMNAIERHLTEAMAPPPPPIDAHTARELSGFAGHYQPIAQRNRLTPLIDSLTIFRKVEISAGGEVRVDGEVRLADVEGRLRRADRAAPGLIFASSDDGALLLSPTESYRKVSSQAMRLKAGYGIVLGATIILSLISLLVTLFRGRAGKAHAAAFAAFLPLAAILGLMIYAIDLPSPKSIALFGHETWLSYSVFAATALAPVGGAAAAFAAVLPGRSGVFARTVAALASVLILIAAAYMAQFGWIALRTWAI